MASTNKTNNFNLSQFIETDKPTFLGDYNTDMNKINDALEANKLNSENNSNSIGNLQELTTQNKLNLVKAINEVNENAKTGGDLKTKVDTLETSVNDLSSDLITTDAKIGTLTNLDTTNKTNLVSAINEVNKLLNLSQVIEYENGNANLIVDDGQATEITGKITLKKNLYNNVFSLSGNLKFKSSGFSGVSIILKNTGIVKEKLMGAVAFAQNPDTKVLVPINASILEGENGTILLYASDIISSGELYANIFLVDAVHVL